MFRGSLLGAGYRHSGVVHPDLGAELAGGGRADSGPVVAPLGAEQAGLPADTVRAAPVVAQVREVTVTLLRLAPGHDGSASIRAASSSRVRALRAGPVRRPPVLRRAV